MERMPQSDWPGAPSHTQRVSGLVCPLPALSGDVEGGGRPERDESGFELTPAQMKLYEFARPDSGARRFTSRDFFEYLGPEDMPDLSEMGNNFVAFFGALRQSLLDKLREVDDMAEWWQSDPVYNRRYQLICDFDAVDAAIAAARPPAPEPEPRAADMPVSPAGSTPNSQPEETPELSAPWVLERINAGDSLDELIKRLRDGGVYDTRVFYDLLVGLQKQGDIIVTIEAGDVLRISPKPGTVRAALGRQAVQGPKPPGRTRRAAAAGGARSAKTPASPASDRAADAESPNPPPKTDQSFTPEECNQAEEILALLAKKPTRMELRRELPGISRTAVRKIVARLEARGLLKRQSPEGGGGMEIVLWRDKKLRKQWDENKQAVLDALGQPFGVADTEDSR